MSITQHRCCEHGTNSSWATGVTPGRNISNMNVPIQVYVPKQWIHKEPHQVFKPPFHKTSLGLGPTVLILDLIYWKTICASLAQCATKIQGTGSVHRVDVLSTDIIIKRDWLAKCVLSILFCFWTESPFLSPKGRERRQEERKFIMWF